MDTRDAIFLVIALIAFYFGNILNVKADNGGTHFQMDVKYRDAYCSDEVDVSDPVRSAIQCANRCSNAQDCKGFFYNKITGKCSTLKKVPNSTNDCQSEQGSVYYKKQECSEPAVMDHASLDTGDTHEGAVRTYTCHDNYITATGSTTISVTCSDIGQWTPGTAICLRDCGNPPELSNVASVSAGHTIEGATKTYTCAFGHVVEKGGVKTTQTTDNATCDASGSWVVDFKCVEICPRDWKLIGQSCYGFTKPVPNDAEGQLACEAEDADAHLAIFQTKEEWENVRSNTWTNAPSLWAYVGGKRNTGDIWKWNDGTPVGEWGWNTGEPDNDNPIDCMFVLLYDRSFMLGDNCFLEVEAFCELELTN